MSYTSNSHPSASDFNDGNQLEALLITAGPVEACESDTTTSTFPSRCYTPDTPHSHDFEPCLGGQAHGQGAPVYSCGCYRRTKVTVDPALALTDALIDSDVFEQHQKLGQVIESCNSQVGGNGSRTWPLKRKRSESKSTFESDSIGDITTPRRFGQHLTNAQRADSVPAPEMPKRRKLGTDEISVLGFVKHLEAAIDRQTEVLAKIYRVLESSAK